MFLYFHHEAYIMLQSHMRKSWVASWEARFVAREEKGKIEYGSSSIILVVEEAK